MDTIISHCVTNLSPDKAKVFPEAYRFLKSGGRLTVSDIVCEGRLPDDIKSDPDAWAGCVAGALEHREYLDTINKAGSRDVRVLSSREFYLEGNEGQASTKLLGITVRACKQER